MDGWISVDERLPEKDGEYLVRYHPCFFDEVMNATIVGNDYFIKKYNMWEFRFSQRVTHWMPFPEFEDD